MSSNDLLIQIDEENESSKRYISEGMDYYREQMPLVTDQELNGAKQSFNESLDRYKNKMEQQITNLTKEIDDAFETSSDFAKKIGTNKFRDGLLTMVAGSGQVAAVYGMIGATE